MALSFQAPWTRSRRHEELTAWSAHAYSDKLRGHTKVEYDASENCRLNGLRSGIFHDFDFSLAWRWS